MKVTANKYRRMGPPSGAEWFCISGFWANAVRHWMRVFRIEACDLWCYRSAILDSPHSGMCVVSVGALGESRIKEVAGLMSPKVLYKAGQPSLWSLRRDHWYEDAIGDLVTIARMVMIHSGCACWVERRKKWQGCTWRWLSPFWDPRGVNLTCFKSNSWAIIK